jgi:hypothetical protein
MFIFMPDLDLRTDPRRIDMTNKIMTMLVGTKNLF